VSRGQRGGSPTVINLSFLDRSRYFSFKQLLIYSHKGGVDPVTDPLLLRKSGSAGNRTPDLWDCSQTTETVWRAQLLAAYMSPEVITSKDKVVPMLNQALHYEDAWGDGCIAPYVLDHGTSWTVMSFVPR
jgi:hypothetical protein